MFVNEENVPSHSSVEHSQGVTCMSYTILNNICISHQSRNSHWITSRSYSVSERSSIPQLSYIRQGFSPTFMCNRKAVDRMSSAQSYHATNGKDEDSGGGGGEPEGDSDGEHVSKTTAIINLQGSVDVMVSPLMLEALQRFVEAVTPTLASLHPSTILDSLHGQCCKSVESQNKLEKCKSGAGADVPENDREADGSDRESRTSRLQVMFSLSKINICLLQATLVEEMIAFSALERVRELTCVSMLALCVDDIHAQLLLSNKAQRPESTDEDPGHCDERNTLDSMPGGGDDQGSERQCEDVVGSLNIRRIHGQLRRMKRNSNFSDHVILTAIPEYQSKVLFTFQKQKHAEGMGTAAKQDVIPLECAEDIAGFIMFECGLEDIRLTGATRKGYQVNMSLYVSGVCQLDSWE